MTENLPPKAYDLSVKAKKYKLILQSQYLEIFKVPLLDRVLVLPVLENLH